MKDVLLRAVYDKVENTLSFYQSDLESTAAASTNAMADAPNIFLDLNQNILEYPIMPMRTCITFYYSEFFGNYYAYTSYTDGSYDILHDTDSMVFNKTWYVSWATSISLKIGVHQIKKRKSKRNIKFLISLSL